MRGPGSYAKNLGLALMLIPWIMKKPLGAEQSECEWSQQQLRSPNEV